MFEKRRTIGALRKLARLRAKAARVRIRGYYQAAVRRIWLVLLRLMVSCGFAALLLLKMNFAPAGIIGAIILFLFWNRAFLDVARPAAFLSLYPASAERIWETRFGIFKIWALGSLIDALAVVGVLVARNMISVPAAWASAPAALAYAACMISLPLALVLAFPRFNPAKLLGLLSFPALIFFLAAKELPPVVTAALAKGAGMLSWVFPFGWLARFMGAHIDPVSRLIFGIAALAAGAIPIRFLADAMRRKVIRREEQADADDARISITGGARAEQETASMSSPESDQPAIQSAGAARSLLEKGDWGTFSEPKEPADKFFWRTLNSRQKMIARMMWPYGFHSSAAANRMALRFVATCLAFAALCKYFHMPGGAWSGIAFGILALLMFLPLLPGYGFVLQPLYLNGRQVARYQLFPVSVTEICNILHRYQTIRLAGRCWAAVAYGALAWLIMGLPVFAGAVSGFILALLVYGFHPLVVIARISAVTRCVGKRLVSIPCVLLLFIDALFALIGLIAGIGVMIPMALEIPPTHTLIMIAPCALGVALVMRFAWWLMLRLQLGFIQRSWVDVVTPIPKKSGARAR